MTYKRSTVRVRICDTCLGKKIITFLTYSIYDKCLHLSFRSPYIPFTGFFVLKKEKF